MWTYDVYEQLVCGGWDRQTALELARLRCWEW